MLSRKISKEEGVRKISVEEGGRKVSKEERRPSKDSVDDVDDAKIRRKDRQDSEISMDDVASRDRDRRDSELSIQSLASAEEASDNEREQRTRYQILRDFAKEAAIELVKVFIDYGPPWKKTTPEMATELIQTVSAMDAKTLSLHFLLNRLYNPNTPDPEDIHNYALHYCARNAHFLQMRMLRRAGAYINVTNELSQIPLMVLVFYKQPPTKRPLQLKALKWMLKLGADVNHRDKGGYTALDFAAMNGDLESVELLLEYGALVRRDNRTLVAQRKPILEHCWNPEIYNVLRKKLKEEDREFEFAETTRQKFAAVVAEEKKREKSMANWYKRKEIKMLAKIEHEKSERIRLDKEAKYQRVSAEMQALEDKKKGVKHRLGQWERNMYGKWSWREIKNRVDKTKVWPDAVKEFDRLKTLTDKDKYADLWNKLTGSELELPWSIGAPFAAEEEQKNEEEEAAGDLIDDFESASASVSGTHSGSMTSTI